MRYETYAVDNLYDMIMSECTHCFFWGSQSQKAGMTMQNGNDAVTKCSAQGTSLLC